MILEWQSVDFHTVWGKLAMFMLVACAGGCVVLPQVLETS